MSFTQSSVKLENAFPQGIANSKSLSVLKRGIKIDGNSAESC